MSKFSFSKWIIVSLALFMSSTAFANDGLRELMKDPNYWVYPGGNYNNWRYSELDQINTGNAGDLVAAWTFSTGRLQGHEGGPLVLPPSETGLATDHLYIHASFPNDVFAIDLETLENHLGLRARTGRGSNRSQDVLRHREPRSGVRRWADLPASRRHHFVCLESCRRQHYLADKERRRHL